jgi:hypothetical protein
VRRNVTAGHGNQCLDVDFVAVGSHWQLAS